MPLKNGKYSKIFSPYPSNPILMLEVNRSAWYFDAIVFTLLIIGLISDRF